MTCLHLTLSVPGAVPASLTLPQPLTPQALLELERAVADTLGMLRHALLSAGVWTAPEHAGRGPDAAEIEYASWLPDPGAIEVASWAAHLRPSLQ
jgi:hypothetical protein